MIMLAACVLVYAPMSSAEEPQVIRFHATEWKDLTNKDGTGLYHEILQRIFESQGFEIEATYFPFRRTLLNVSIDEADIAGATTNDQPDLLPARNPIWVSRNSALFHKKMLPTWEGLRTIILNPNTSVSSPGIGKMIGVDIYEVPSRDQALNMVLDKRMRYYVDDYETLTKLKAGEKNVVGFEGWKPPSSINNFDWDRFVIRDVRSVPAYMVFQNNEKGRRLRDLFDSEFEKLHRSGELIKIYEKWGLAAKMPRDISN